VPAGVAQAAECICTTQTCGAGILNTNAAVLAAQRPLAIVTAPSTITVGVATSIDGSTSFASNGRTIASHQWTAIGVTGATPTFANASQPITTVQMSDASTFTLRLTVTDNQGTQDTADVAMATTTPPPPTPVPPATIPPVSSGGGGGGGNLGWLMLFLLSISAWRRVRSGTR
jgi:serine protease